MSVPLASPNAIANIMTDFKQVTSKLMPVVEKICYSSLCQDGRERISTLNKTKHSFKSLGLFRLYVLEISVFDLKNAVKIIKKQ